MASLRFLAVVSYTKILPMPKLLIFTIQLLFMQVILATNKPAVKSGAGQLSNICSGLNYQIAVTVIPESKSIVGSNQISLYLTKPVKQLTLDLFEQLTVHAIENNRQQALKYQRKGKKISINFAEPNKAGDTLTFTVYYSGTPIEAKKAPWDGGFVWQKDSVGNHWIGLACQGMGAACWLPCFDNWNVEPTAVISIKVPVGYTGVSNGKLVNTYFNVNGFDEFVWQVVNPINVYNITVNVGKYTHLKDEYINAKNGILPLDYYVLNHNAAKAGTHFQQVKRMMQCFEQWVGPYPFYADGYKLVETPYWGMEHQSCVSYGNDYEYNKFGFDFIIIHESAHEWFGNSLTAADRADFWIHESFTTYMETYFTECLWGRQRANEYIATQKSYIQNKHAMVGKPGNNWQAPDNDVYYKGAWMLHTLRNGINNEEKWRKIMFDFATHFTKSTLTTAEVIAFFSKAMGTNLKPFFNAYLQHAQIPNLHYILKPKNGVTELHYKLVSEQKGLKMNIAVKLGKRGYDFIEATPSWQVIDIPFEDFKDFEIDPNFLVNKKQVSKR